MLFPHQDKLLHAGEYALLGLLCARALALGRTIDRHRWVLLGGWAIAALYGASDELHQLLVPLRQADLWDWLADALGALLGAAAWVVWLRRRERQARPG